MLATRRGGSDPGSVVLPLFPLRTVLFPGGVLPLRIFEQRYITMAKTCLKDGTAFGVCLITQGEEVAGDPTGTTPRTPEFADVGTIARIGRWDMPQLGILHVQAEGTGRFRVLTHTVQADGLVFGALAAIPTEPARPLCATYEPLVRLLELLANRIGPQHFPQERYLEDASWVGYRLAELLPLPLTIKQSMLEINDCEVRLAVLAKFLREQGLL